MLKINFYNDDKIDEAVQFKYAIIAARYKGKWVFVRHKERKTWEIPAGHREESEDINDTAARELQEETGAKKFHIYPVCAYSVTEEGPETFGFLFFAEIEEFDKLPDFETGEIIFCDEMPENLSYPLIQPVLFRKVRQFLYGH
jgi:8-oxo-dGTP diphosphatase